MYRTNLWSGTVADNTMKTHRWFWMGSTCYLHVVENCFSTAAKSQMRRPTKKWDKNCNAKRNALDSPFVCLNPVPNRFRSRLESCWSENKQDDFGNKQTNEREKKSQQQQCRMRNEKKSIVKLAKSNLRALCGHTTQSIKLINKIYCTCRNEHQYLQVANHKSNHE